MIFVSKSPCAESVISIVFDTVLTVTVAVFDVEPGSVITIVSLPA